MDEIQQFMSDCIESSNGFNNRSKAQKTFDKMVITSINSGEKIELAIKNAATQMPQMSDFASISIPELNKYYSQLKRLESEIAIANNFRMISAMRKRKAQQSSGSDSEKAEDGRS
jgi:hypothetical protein